jgi:hypothetical protein
MERGKARTLVEQLELRGVDLFAGIRADVADELRERYTARRVEAASLEKRLSLLAQQPGLSEDERREAVGKVRAELGRARQKLLEAHAEIRNASPAYRLIAGKDRKPTALAEVRTWVASMGGLLLEYSIGTEESFVLVLKGEGGTPELVKLALTEEHARTLGTSSRLLTADRLRAVLATKEGTGVLQLLNDPKRNTEALPKLAALYRVLLPESVRTSLGGGNLKRLVVIPDGPLALLPFEALVVRGGRETALPARPGRPRALRPLGDGAAQPGDAAGGEAPHRARARANAGGSGVPRAGQAAPLEDRPP